ncbi:hypothetical protein BRADI_1g26430v3 [Brachypodium distachyon]|uniref:Uncharacterized protein n=1 Tax=Brachypodium distachyon TaxID=15368 RepID=A0A0Q3JVC3_BRADI|nr:hypothetical protein BRADI_1g26430v3 [Brachypodium distachyon]
MDGWTQPRRRSSEKGRRQRLVVARDGDRGGPGELWGVGGLGDDVFVLAAAPRFSQARWLGRGAIRGTGDGELAAAVEKLDVEELQRTELQGYDGGGYAASRRSSRRGGGAREALERAATLRRRFRRSSGRRTARAVRARPSSRDRPVAVAEAVLDQQTACVEPSWRLERQGSSGEPTEEHPVQSS